MKRKGLFDNIIFSFAEGAAKQRKRIEPFIDSNRVMIYPDKDDPDYGEKMRSLRIDDSRRVTSSDGFTLMPHQSETTSFLNLRTQRHSILFFFEMGSGKSILAINMVENMKSLLQEHHTKALVLVPNKLIESVFEMELLGKFDGRYRKRVTGDEYMSRKLRVKLNHAIRSGNQSEKKRLEKYVLQNVHTIYDIQTHKKWEQDVAKMSDEEVTKVFSNRIIVVDEVHRAKNPDSGFYRELSRVARLSRNTRLIGMTAKPLIDNPKEFCQYIRLMHLNDGFLKEELLTPKIIEEMYSNDQSVKERAHKIFSKAVDGYIVCAVGHHPVWYPTRVDIGCPQKEINQLYQNNIAPILDESVLQQLGQKFQSSQQQQPPQQPTQQPAQQNRDCILLSPVPIEGPQLEACVNNIMTEFLSNHDLEPNEMWNGSRRDARGIKNGKKICSAVFEKIYSDAQKVIQKGPIVVYCFFVEQGMFWFEEFLKEKGVKPFQENMIQDPSQDYYFNFARPYSNGALKKAIQICQNHKNREGSLIKWILGTRKIGIGITISNAARVVSIGADWNSFSQNQFFGRCIRFGSHAEKRAIIQVVRYAIVITKEALMKLPFLLRAQFGKFCQKNFQALVDRGFIDPQTFHFKSIDEYMYDIVWQKHQKIGQMEKWIYQNSMLFYDLNNQYEGRGKSGIENSIEALFRMRPIWNVNRDELGSSLTELHEYVKGKVEFRGWQNQLGIIVNLGEGYYQFTSHSVKLLADNAVKDGLQDFIHPVKFIDTLFLVASASSNVTSYYVPTNFKKDMFYLSSDGRLFLKNDGDITGVFTNTPNNPNCYQFKVTSNHMESVCSDKSIKEINSLASKLNIILPEMKNRKCRTQMVESMLEKMIDKKLILPWSPGERPTLFRLLRISQAWNIPNAQKCLFKLHDHWAKNDLEAWSAFIIKVLGAQKLWDTSDENSTTTSSSALRAIEKRLKNVPFYFFRLLDQMNTKRKKSKTRPKRFSNDSWTIVQQFRKKIRDRYAKYVSFVEQVICKEIEKRTT